MLSKFSRATSLGMLTVAMQLLWRSSRRKSQKHLNRVHDTGLGDATCASFVRGFRMQAQGQHTELAFA